MTNRIPPAALALLLLTASTAPGEDWPQWRGPKRDGKSTETNLLTKWPKGGPKLLWTATGLGVGFSTVSVVGDTIYTTGMDKETKIGFVHAVGLDGRAKWKTPYGKEFIRIFASARSTPTIDGSRGYVMSSEGLIFCFDAKSGRKIWSVDTAARFGARNITWGMAESPLIEGDKVICTPGGHEAVMVALDAKTGRTVWKAAGLADMSEFSKVIAARWWPFLPLDVRDFSDKSGYCSPIAFDHGGKRQICTVTSGNVVGVDAADGTILWKYAHPAPWGANPNTPIYHDGFVFATSGYDYGAVLLKLSDDGKSVRPKWTLPAFDTHHGNVILLDGYLYGSNWKSNRDGNWMCVEFKTGKIMYDIHWEDKGTLRYAAGMFYAYNEDGTVALVKTSPQKFEIVSSFAVTAGEGKHWAHPVVAGGRLYIRHGGSLMAYDVKGK